MQGEPPVAESSEEAIEEMRLKGFSRQGSEDKEGGGTRGSGVAENCDGPAVCGRAAPVGEVKSALGTKSSPGLEATSAAGWRGSKGGGSECGSGRESGGGCEMTTPLAPSVVTVLDLRDAGAEGLGTRSGLDVDRAGGGGSGGRTGWLGAPTDHGRFTAAGALATGGAFARRFSGSFGATGAVTGGGPLGVGSGRVGRGDSFGGGTGIWGAAVNGAIGAYTGPMRMGGGSLLCIEGGGDGGGPFPVGRS